MRRDAPMRDISLAAWQDAFAAALFSGPDAAPPEIAALAAQPGFAVYRNTVMKGCVDALRSNHPAVARLVGEAWFQAAAIEFSRTHQPRDPRLMDHGAELSDWLAGFEPARELPYLPGVARLDRLWTEAHLAADAPLLAANAFAVEPPGDIGQCRLALHPAARWAWFDAHPAFTIWSRNRTPQEADGSDGKDIEAREGGNITWRAEGALLTRPEGAVRWRLLDRAGCAFLAACGHDATLADAADAALAHDPTLDLANLLGELIRAGAFTALVPAHSAPANLAHEVNLEPQP